MWGRFVLGSGGGSPLRQHKRTSEGVLNDVSENRCEGNSGNYTTRLLGVLL